MKEQPQIFTHQIPSGMNKYLWKREQDFKLCSGTALMQPGWLWFVWGFFPLHIKGTEQLLTITEHFRVEQFTETCQKS